MSGEITRVRRPKREASEWYSRLGPWYDLADPFERRHRRAGIDLLAARPGERVLEVGPGTGRGLVALAGDVGPAGRVVGVDIAAGMCRQARRAVREAGVADRVDVVRGEATTLPVAESAVDAVFTAFTLDLFDTPEIPVVLEECRRALRGEGRIVVVSLSKAEGGLATDLYEAAHVRFPARLDCRPIYVAEALSEAGYDILERRVTSMWGLPVEVVLAAG